MWEPATKQKSLAKCTSNEVQEFLGRPRAAQGHSNQTFREQLEKEEIGCVASNGTLL